jgi:hypothetical protein
VNLREVDEHGPPIGTIALPSLGVIGDAPEALAPPRKGVELRVAHVPEKHLPGPKLRMSQGEVSAGVERQHGLTIGPVEWSVNTAAGE